MPSEYTISFYGSIVTILQFVVVFVTAILIYRQVRIQAHTHVVRTVEDMMRLWNSSHYAAMRRKVCRKYLAGDESFDSTCEELCEIFERFGLYSSIGAVPKDVMWEAISWFIEYYYEMFQDGLRNMRNYYNDETLFSNFESISMEMHRISKRKGAPNSEKSRKEVVRF